MRPPFTFDLVGIFGERPFELTEPLTHPPYQFAFSVPRDITPGPYMFNAVGTIEGRDSIFSDVSLHVERPDLPRKLKPQFPLLGFDYRGDSARMLVEGEFPDGSIVDLTRSSKTTYTLDRPQLVSIDADGRFTAREAGSATLTIRHGGTSAQVQLSVRRPVIVAPSWMVLHPSESQQFDALLSNAENDSSVVWRITPEGVGRIDHTGRYTAPRAIPAVQIINVTASRTARPAQHSSAKVWLYPAGVDPYKK